MHEVVILPWCYCSWLSFQTDSDNLPPKIWEINKRRRLESPLVESIKLNLPHSSIREKISNESITIFVHISNGWSAKLTTIIMISSRSVLEESLTKFCTSDRSNYGCSSTIHFSIDNVIDKPNPILGSSVMRNYHIPVASQTTIVIQLLFKTLRHSFYQLPTPLLFSLFKGALRLILP